MIFGLLLTFWLFQIYTQGRVSPWVIWPAALFAIASAGYSAFLFAQARGRDFWQSPLLFWHLLVKAVLAGAAVLILIGSLEFVTPYRFMSPLMFAWLINILVVSLFVSLAMIFSELFMKHGAEDAVRAGDLLLTRAIEQILLALCRRAGRRRAGRDLFFVPVGSLIPLYVLAPILALFGFGCTTISGSKPAKRYR